MRILSMAPPEYREYLRNALCAFCLVFTLSGASAATLTWAGGNGNWNNNSNWSPSGPFPIASDNIGGATSTVTLSLNSGGTVGTPVDVTRAVSNFTYVSGSNWVLLGDDFGTATLAVSGTLEKGGTSTWDFQSNSVGTSRLMAVTAANVKVTGGAMNLGGYNSNGKELKSLAVSGATEISGGILRVATSSAGTVNYSLGALTMTSGTLALNAKAVSSTVATTGTVSSMAGTGGGVILGSDPAVSGTSTLAIATSSTTSTDASLRDGAGLLSVIKTGAGQQTLLGASTYTGGTQIQQGTLVAGNNTALGTGAVTVSSVGTLLTSANVTVAKLALSGGTTDIGGSASTNSLTLTGTGAAFSMSAGTLKISYNGALADSILGSASGSFSITGGVLDLSNSAWNYAGTYQIFSGFGSGSVSGLTYQGYDSSNYLASLGNTGLLSFAAVPEPTPIALLGLGALLTWSLRRRRSIA